MYKAKIVHFDLVPLHANFEDSLLDGLTHFFASFEKPTQNFIIW